jgi:hypothetical protein
MYSSTNENKLIFPDIADRMVDYVSLQLDIDSTKILAAALVAQEMDIKRVIGSNNIDRCIEDPTGETPLTDNDKALRELLIPPLCYYTYSRCLLMFHGIFTDSGLILNEADGAQTRNEAKGISTEMKSIGEAFMLDVIEFLEEEKQQDPSIDETWNEDKLTPRVRTFGGREWRGTN